MSPSEKVPEPVMVMAASRTSVEEGQEDVAHNTPEKTKRALIEAFVELYEHDSVDRITIGEITYRAGFNRGTFYTHFKDVYDILEQAEELVLDEFERTCLEAMPNGLAAMGSQEFFQVLVNAFEREETIISVVLRRGSWNFRHRLIERVQEHLLEGRPLPTEATWRVDYALEYHINAIIDVLTYWDYQGRNLTKEDLFALLVQLADVGFKAAVKAAYGLMD